VANGHDWEESRHNRKSDKTMHAKILRFHSNRFSWNFKEVTKQGIFFGPGHRCLMATSDNVTTNASDPEFPFPVQCSPIVSILFQNSHVPKVDPRLLGLI
jgi:hypothetical protein